MMNACSMHNHNVCVKSPDDKFLGQEVINFKTSLQLVFAAYAFQKESEPQEFRVL